MRVVSCDAQAVGMRGASGTTTSGSTHVEGVLLGTAVEDVHLVGGLVQDRVELALVLVLRAQEASVLRGVARVSPRHTLIALSSSAVWPMSCSPMSLKPESHIWPEKSCTLAARM
jgi:hypothetical protein